MLKHLAGFTVLIVVCNGALTPDLVDLYVTPTDCLSSSSLLLYDTLDSAVLAVFVWNSIKSMLFHKIMQMLNMLAI